MLKWLECLTTFKIAIGRMEEFIELSNLRKLNQCERDSFIKEFEFSFEIAWRLMMSYEKENGVAEVHGSKDVLRQAYSMSIIENGEVWLKIIDAGNIMSHLYDEKNGC